MDDNHDKENKNYYKNATPRLIICYSCNNKFSERAKACPECGAIQTKECKVCHSLIPAASSQCPECGDPSPFFIQDNNQKKPGTNRLQTHIVNETKSKTVIKRLLITAPFVLFIMLIVGAVKELMRSGLLRGVIIVLCFLSIF